MVLENIQPSAYTHMHRMYVITQQTTEIGKARSTRYLRIADAATILSL